MLFSDFLRHFVVGKNGGRASFQAKRAQQVSCLSIIVVYIVLCSEIRNCTWKISSLEPFESSDQDNSRSIRGAPQPCFGVHEFSPIFYGQTCLFVFTFLIISQSPTSSGEEWLCKSDWLIPRRRSIAKLGTVKKKKVRQRRASRWPAPQPRVSSPPFSTAKNRHEITE